MKYFLYFIGIIILFWFLFGGIFEDKTPSYEPPDYNLNRSGQEPR